MMTKMTIQGVKGEFVYDSQFQDVVEQFTWHAKIGRYAQTNIPKRMTCTGSRETVALHQLVIYLHYDIPLGCKAISDHGYCIDHINHNTFDNSITNLQIIPSLDNSCKQVATGSSIYTGVTWLKKDCKWQVQIRNNGKREYLGRYVDEKEAARVFDKRARQIGGNRRLNFPLDSN